MTQVKIWRRLLLSLAVVAAALFGAVLTARALFNAPGGFQEETVVLIPEGAGLSRVVQILDDATVLRHPLVFESVVRVRGLSRDLRAGEYAVPARASMAEVLTLLLSGKTVQRRLTIPEGLTSSQIVGILAAADGLTGEIGETPAEGSLLPETYYYSYGDSRADIIKRMRRDQEDLLVKLWEARGSDFTLDSIDAAVTLASIVEKETGLPSERGRIAAVFHNRLKRGMKLQSDPTVIYGMTGGKPLDRALTSEDLDAPTPYNTYVIDGLPPGPICNPGVAALRAAFNPAHTNDLYFVADGSGGHVFAETLDEHNRNVSNWRRLRREMQGNSSPSNRRN